MRIQDTKQFNALLLTAATTTVRVNTSQAVMCPCGISHTGNYTGGQFWKN